MDNYGYLVQLKAKPRSLRLESLNKLSGHCKVGTICILGEADCKTIYYGWPYGQEMDKIYYNAVSVCGRVGDILA